MQFHLQKFKFPFLLLIVCLIAYLPLSSFLFALKNDAFAYNFPNKYFFSEVLRNGYLPTWNPYLNYGFPLYADPGFAWWNPITWLFGLIGYNVYTFSIEVLMYIYIAGLGMYWLGKKLNVSPLTSFIIGCMFMCSGFFIGNLQHINFITCAAFLPWLVGFWLKFQDTSNLKNALLFGITAYMLCTGGHPAIPVATAFFILLLTILYYFYFKYPPGSKKFFINQFMLLAIALVFLLPLLLSYLQIIPYYSRTGPVDHSTSADTGFTITSFISFLYPFATIKNNNFFMTDVSMRNIYFTIPGFLFFISFLLNKQKQNIQYIFLIAGLIMIILSMGGMIKEIIYDNLPLFSWIRTNGEFRVFVIFSFLLGGSFELEKAIGFKNVNNLLFRRLLVIVLIISTLLLIGILVFNSGVSFSINDGSFINSLKYLLDSLTFKQTLLISMVVTMILTISYLYSIGKSKKIFCIILLADIFLNSWLLLPVTGVGKTSTTNIQKVIDKSPAGFPTPLTTSLKSEPLSEEENKWIVDWKWYNKKVNHETIDYPSQLKTTQNFLSSNDTSTIFKKPFVFFTSGKTNDFSLNQFTPSSIEIQLNLSEPDTLVILQNNFPGWQAFVNNKKVEIKKYKENFISVPVSPNSKTVNFKFSLLSKK
jgi:hypothetical protein